MEGTLTHSLTSHSHTQSGAHIHSLTHSFTDLPLSHTEWNAHSLQVSFTHRLEGTLTHSLSHSLTEITLTPTPSLSHSLIHSPPNLTYRMDQNGMQTHSLSGLPLSQTE